MTKILLVLPLRIAYAGRASWEKGITDWVDAIKIARASGLDVEATWFGDGPLLNASKEATIGLPYFTFRGTLPHSQLISELKTFNAFAFCHNTEESPRCLIEALMCGLPLIGYASNYPKDLIKNGGGFLTEHTPAALAEALVAFAPEQQSLTREALAAGAEFSDEAVFRHRSNIIKQIGRHTTSSL